MKESHPDAPRPYVLPKEVREVAAEAEVWQADVVALPMVLEDDPTARPVATVVTVDNEELAGDVLMRVSAEPENVARLIDLAVGVAIESVGASPRRVRVRDAEVGDAVEPLLRRRGLAVEVGRVHGVDVVTAGRVLDLTGDIPWPGVSMAHTWAGWGLPPDRVAEIFRAAARLWRAAPWDVFPSGRFVRVVLPDDTRWIVEPLGDPGPEKGLELSAPLEESVAATRPDPRGRTAGGGLLDDFLDGPPGRVLKLTYHPLHEIPRPMQREVPSAGWEVAAPEAYPALITINTPAGGVTRRDAAGLTAVLLAMAALPEEELERIVRGDAAEWRDPDTGVVIRADEIGRDRAG